MSHPSQNLGPSCSSRLSPLYLTPPRLPTEILDLILHFYYASTCYPVSLPASLRLTAPPFLERTSPLFVSRLFYALAIPKLYRVVALESPTSYISFFGLDDETIEARKAKGEELSWESSRLCHVEALRLKMRFLEGDKRWQPERNALEKDMGLILAKLNKSFVRAKGSATYGLNGAQLKEVTIEQGCWDDILPRLGEALIDRSLTRFTLRYTDFDNYPGTTFDRFPETEHLSINTDVLDSAPDLEISNSISIAGLAIEGIARSHQIPNCVEWLLGSRPILPALQVASFVISPTSFSLEGAETWRMAWIDEREKGGRGSEDISWLKSVVVLEEAQEDTFGKLWVIGEDETAVFQAENDGAAEDE